MELLQNSLRAELVPEVFIDIDREQVLAFQL